VIQTVSVHGIYKTKFKNCRKKKSFCFNSDIKIDRSGRLKIPKLKTTLRMSEMNKFQGKLKKATLIKKYNGWFACCVYDEQRQPIVPTGTKMEGIDSGLSTSLTFSDGEQINFIQPFKAQEKRLATAQRKSPNSKKHKALHRRVAAQRKDYHHKLSTMLAKSHMKICWSDDSFPRLKKLFGKKYSDLGFGQFRDFLANKLASRTDGFGELIRVPSAYSTQRCHSCRALTGPSGRSGLQVREWVCSGCGTIHNRDVNAAIVTKLSGLGAQMCDDGHSVVESSEQGKSSKSSNIVLN
ncbi:hypothetical protein MNBD_GAMMA08-1814, partial [hydrothermal vent metagenome]